MGRILNPVFNEFTSWCAGKKNSSVNQIVTKRTAHPPSFETGQMCSSIYTPLVFKQLKRQLHPEVNSLKWLFGSWRGGASLLLRKEWRNAGKRDSLEGVQKRSTVKVGLGEVLAIWGGGIFADSHTEKLSSQQLRGFPAIQCRNMARTEHQGFTKKQHRPFFHSAALSVEMVWNARHETIQTYHKTAQMKLHAQNCTHAPKRSRLTTKRHDSLG